MDDFELKIYQLDEWVFEVKLWVWLKRVVGK